MEKWAGQKWKGKFELRCLFLFVNQSLIFTRKIKLPYTPKLLKNAFKWGWSRTNWLKVQLICKRIVQINVIMGFFFVKQLMLIYDGDEENIPLVWDWNYRVEIDSTGLRAFIFCITGFCMVWVFWKAIIYHSLEIKVQEFLKGIKSENGIYFLFSSRTQLC